MLKRSDALVQIFAKWDERVFVEEPGGEPIFLAVVFGAELLLGHDFNVVPVPNVHGGRVVVLFVSIFCVGGVFCGGVGGFCGIGGLCTVSGGSCGLCRFADFVFPFCEAEENDSAVESPFGFVEGDGASSGGEF